MACFTTKFHPAWSRTCLKHLPDQCFNSKFFINTVWLVHICILEGSPRTQGNYMAHPSKVNQNQYKTIKEATILCLLKRVNNIQYPKLSSWVNNEGINKNIHRRNCLRVILMSCLLLFMAIQTVIYFSDKYPTCILSLVFFLLSVVWYYMSLIKIYLHGECL